uniref:WD_REPEATS_REGION domain-containing protein n=1 Tax=Echinostoma caproni TaxID=27848 RepID=A0A183AL09_9TREM
LHFGENPEPDPTRKAKHFALLDLGQALKPHVKSVTSMAYNKNATYFVTGSEDETIFFFSVSGKMLSPIGFFNVGGAVAKVEWIPSRDEERGDVLVYLRLGCVIKVSCPSMDEVDHSKSFMLANIQPTGGFNLLSIKSRLLHDEDSAEKLRRYENEKKNRMEIRKARAEREPETEEDAQRLDDEEELIRQGVMSEIADWAPTYPSEPSPIAYGTLDPNDPNYFWVSMDNFDSGYLYKCRLSDPPMSVQDAFDRAKAEVQKMADLATENTSNPPEMPTLEDMEAIDKRLIPSEPVEAARVNGRTTITYWKFSGSGKRLLIGMKDGTIRVQLLERPFDMTSFSGYWNFRMHDCTRGGVNRITLSHDEKFLMSIGDDGTFFLCELMSEELQNKEITEFRARIPSAYEAQLNVDDIADPKAQSIEQAKQKAEYDRLISLAEQKKAETRKKVTELRLRFRRLKEQNERLPERIRLSKEDFNLVPQIRDDLLKDRASKIDLVYRETAWLSEKCRLALEKLHNTFRKPLDFERVVVHAFCTGHCVASVRTNRLSEEHNEAKHDLARIKAERLARTLHLEQRTSQLEGTAIRAANLEASRSAAEGSQQQMKGARGLRIARQLHVLEETQRKRRARREQWATLLAMKPADDYEDPEDLKAIAQAKERMGDFKLKSSQDYVVPERATLNAFEAKLRLVEMVEEAFKLRHEFNASVVALRDKKKKIIEELNKIDVQLEELQDFLPQNEALLRLRIPGLLPEEFPEK